METREICVSDLIFLSDSLQDKLEKMIAMNVSYVELLMDGTAWNTAPKCFDQYVNLLQSYGFKYSVHPPAWDTNLTSENKSMSEASYLEYCRSIEFAHAIGSKNVVIHPGFCYSPAFNKIEAQKRAQELVSRLCEVAKQLNITLAIENVGYGGTSLFTKAEYVEFVRGLDKSAAFLIDTGHAHLNGWDIPALIAETADRLCSIHLHDNYADSDTHLPILAGSIEWEPVLAELSKVKSCLPILEFAPHTEMTAVTQAIATLQRSL